jgi:hypothetical protein
MTFTNSLAKENVLKFNPLNLKKLYRIEIAIEESLQDITKISYNAEIEVVEVYHNGSYLASVTLDNFKVNGFEPDLMMEQLAHKCRKPLETLEFIIAANGEIANIHNHPEIIEKWKLVKERLEIEYSGDNFEKYVSLTDKVMQDKEALMAGLKKDIFISQFFYPLYNEAFFDYSKKNVENIRFFNINYEIDMILRFQENVSLSGNMSIIKEIDTKEYDFSKMPVDLYKSEYLLNHRMEILNISGRFENHGRKYIFRIIEKYGGN